jgi:hypothetical protein
MVMLKRRTCGEVFSGIYVPEGSDSDVKSAAAAASADPLHTCSRGHNNEYATADYLDWS